VDAHIESSVSLEGSVKAPPSKAYTHRALIASLLSEGESRITRPLICDDTLATLHACRLLGAEIKKLSEGLIVEGSVDIHTPENIINCRESGSTIRFMSPVCALAPGISVLTGRKGLRRRPMAPLLSALRQLGVQCYSCRGDDRPPLIIFGGGMEGGSAKVRGDVSSQHISGILFAAPKARKDVELELITPLYSKPYVEMTIETLKKHGVEVSFEGKFLSVQAGQSYRSHNHIIEGDYSSASFLLAAAALIPSKVEVEGLDPSSLQGDRAIIEILKSMGVPLKTRTDAVIVESSGGRLSSIEYCAENTPDLIPPLMVLASYAEGETVIKGVERLRWKESDRVNVLALELGKMGGRFRLRGDKVIVEGVKELKGAEMSSHNDHRVAMSLTVAALAAKGRSVIHNINCIRKSYPNFINDIIKLGGKIHLR